MKAGALASCECLALLEAHTWKRQSALDNSLLESHGACFHTWAKLAFRASTREL